MTEQSFGYTTLADILFNATLNFGLETFEMNNE